MKSNSLETSEVVKLSFVLDDYRRYTIPDSILVDKFFFPPIDLKDKIWTETHELDLLTGEWIKLKRKFGMPRPVQIRENGIWIDSLTSNVYIACSYNDLIEYNTQSNTFRAIELRHVSSLLARKDFIFFGTAYGLYKYSRDTHEALRVENFPYGLSVYTLESLSDDSLRLNHEFIYRIQKSQLTKIGKAETVVPDYNLNPIGQVLPQTSHGPYETIKDDSLTWFHSQGSIYWKKKQDIFHFTNLDSGYLRQLRVDSRHLYLLFNHQFLILNKDYAIKHSELFDAPSYQAELNAIQALRFENLSLRQVMSRIDSFQSIYGHSKHPDIVSRVNGLSDFINHSISQEDYRLEVELSIQKESLPKKFMRDALTGLIHYYTLQGELNRALQYSKKLHEDFPDYTVLNPIIACITSVKTSMDSIEYLVIERDERLYLYALQKQKLTGCGYWFGEMWIDDTLVVKTYEQILETYPTSEFADNAAYYLVKRKYVQDEGIVYSAKDIEDVEQFIEEYPTSDLKIEAVLNIARMSLSFSGEVKEQLVVLEKAKTKLSKLTVQQMTDKQRDRFLDYRPAIDSQIIKYCNELSR